MKNREDLSVRLVFVLDKGAKHAEGIPSRSGLICRSTDHGIRLERV